MHCQPSRLPPAKGYSKVSLGSLVLCSNKLSQHATCSTYFRSAALLPQLNAPHYCAAHTHTRVAHTHTRVCVYNKYTYYIAFWAIFYGIFAARAVSPLEQMREKLHFSRGNGNGNGNGSSCTNRMPKQIHPHTITHTDMCRAGKGIRVCVFYRLTLCMRPLQQENDEYET